MTDETTGTPSQQDRPRYRAGQVVAFQVTDPTSGDTFTGHGLVLKVAGDVADLAILGSGHVQAHVDALAPAKADDVHNPLPAPAAGDDTSS